MKLISKVFSCSKIMQYLMSTQAFRGDLLKLCAAGNCILVHNMIGIFESLEKSLRLIEVLQQ